MILQAMMLVPELLENKALRKIVENTVRFTIELQASNGSFPTKLEESTVEAKKFQWCHGAPGAIPMYISAARVFGEDDPELKSQCIEAAVKAGEGIYKYGILLKGNGLCHGISGNAYMLHSLTRYFTESALNPQDTPLATSQALQTDPEMWRAMTYAFGKAMFHQ